VFTKESIVYLQKSSKFSITQSRKKIIINNRRFKIYLKHQKTFRDLS